MTHQQVSIGAKIKQHREAKGWNQKELAEKADVSPSTISGVENGRFTPSPDILQRLSTALGIPLQDAEEQRADLPVNTRLDLARIHLYRREYEQTMAVLTDIKQRAELLDSQRDEITLLEARALLLHADDRMPAMELLYALSHKLESAVQSDPIFTAAVQNTLGDGWSLNGDFVTASHHFKRGLEILTSLALPDHPLLGTLHQNLGVASRMLRHDADALAYTHQASELFSKYNTPRKVGEMFFALGETYKGLNLSKQSAEAYRKSLLFYEYADVRQVGVRSISDAAFFGGATPQQAIAFLQMELQVLSEHEKHLERAQVLARIAKLYLDLEDLPQAQATIAAAVDLSSSYEPCAERAYILLIYAKVLLEAGAYEQANDYAFQASDIYATLLYYHLDLKESLRVGKEAILRLRDSLTTT
ncbi:helix-turn-helix domain-containing protein [Tumebacillus permanentifrigoris]|uniref:Helix-turn-helix protein n=1 Tax=Tumebacillus permanentifrigoris TaxID=378543 RepID=A0A316D7M3_9BACL|nr:helix-turn-helix transcriptional regulator [Tumebacillus permanentifrigoris]PWK09581.1 helix-turn-helix protein [Tumebacillus permanentifrigoris]